MAKYKGSLLSVALTGTSPVIALVVVSGASREFEVNEKATEIDVTTRDSTAKEYLADFSENDWTLSGIDVVGGAPVLAFDVGDVLTVDWYPEGNTTGKRKRSASGTVSTKSESYPYDGAVAWSIGGKLTTAITQTTVV